MSKSTRAWLTTIRFGEPNIQTIIQYKDSDGNVVEEELRDAIFRYPRTILADIQKRPHLPPPPITRPEEEINAFMCTYAYEEFDEEGTKPEFSLVDIVTDTELYWAGRDEGEEEPHKQTAPLVHGKGTNLSLLWLTNSL